MGLSAIKEDLLASARHVEGFLRTSLHGRGVPERLLTSMEYSLLAGGKRLRPVLCLKWAKLCGLDMEKAMPFAASLELIHTYSLIHDDLPAMDNDDLRRGKPSNHKQFDEATAILAGDGLLTEAFSLMAQAAESLPAERVVCAMKAVAAAAGAGGMVGGQALDMEYTGKAGISLDQLQTMHAMKTGALIRVACLSGAMLAGSKASVLEKASTYGAAIGVAFQIADDILDVVGNEQEIGKPVGSDEQAGKNTYPSLVGLAESHRLARLYVDRAVECLEEYSTSEADFLRQLAFYIVERVS
ncbi:polyprenyl synthetase family protein [Desulfocurvibacter africanus]|uniref:Farnesyltranstransferase n=1 Tax=Desulfocurvibacter africanus subsp. africanus str. Walvis Bay TaxID=690850 RepID=F3Z262_DESAF|nr:farnesyl diphosphate synthase [Desulfocurvibacter africanus]EGJ51271.1 Farnesyltranstransferase [Desulfocurvibacter africanus subsp. africanus str. Walvis Bay]